MPRGSVTVGGLRRGSVEGSARSRTVTHVPYYTAAKVTVREIWTVLTKCEKLSSPDVETTSAVLVWKLGNKQCRWTWRPEKANSLLLLLPPFPCRRAMTSRARYEEGGANRAPGRDGQFDQSGLKFLIGGGAALQPRKRIYILYKAGWEGHVISAWWQK